MGNMSARDELADQLRGRFVGSKEATALELGRFDEWINAVNPAPEEAAGSLLRQARESQRMSIEHLASVVKVPVGKLQALESEDWSTLSDPNLARALAMTVCRALRSIPRQSCRACLLRWRFLLAVAENL